MSLKGSCLCGQVQYEVQELAGPIQHCHCRTCRKAHAAAFNTSVAVRPDHFKWLRGKEQLKMFESSPGRQRCFCGNCGSHLVKKTDGNELLALRLGSLDDDPGQQPRRHIWASHALPWLHPDPDLPSYPEWPPEYR